MSTVAQMRSGITALSHADPPLDAAVLAAAKVSYLDWMIRIHQQLRIPGLQTGGGVVEVPLEQVYVALRVDPTSPSERAAAQQMLLHDVEEIVAAGDYTPEQEDRVRWLLRTDLPVPDYLGAAERIARAGGERDTMLNIVELYERSSQAVVLGDPATLRDATMRVAGRAPAALVAAAERVDGDQWGRLLEAVTAVLLKAGAEPFTLDAGTLPPQARRRALAEELVHRLNGWGDDHHDHAHLISGTATARLTPAVLVAVLYRFGASRYAGTAEPDRAVSAYHQGVRDRERDGWPWVELLVRWTETLLSDSVNEPTSELPASNPRSRILEVTAAAADLKRDTFRRQVDPVRFEALLADASATTTASRDGGRPPGCSGCCAVARTSASPRCSPRSAMSPRCSGRRSGRSPCCGTSTTAWWTG